MIFFKHSRPPSKHVHTLTCTTTRNGQLSPNVVHATVALSEGGAEPSCSTKGSFCIHPVVAWQTRIHTANRYYEVAWLRAGSVDTNSSGSMVCNLRHLWSARRALVLVFQVQMLTSSMPDTPPFKPICANYSSRPEKT